MNPMELTDVRSRSEFDRFMTKFRQDLAARPDDWENADLPRFLDAMAAWIDDVEVHSSPEAWSLLAAALSAAKIYE
jgi:hypothetical protein